MYSYIFLVTLLVVPPLVQTGTTQRLLDWHKIGTDVRGFRMIDPTDFGDTLIFHPLAPSSQKSFDRCLISA